MSNGLERRRSIVSSDLYCCLSLYCYAIIYTNKYNFTLFLILMRVLILLLSFVLILMRTSSTGRELYVAWGAKYIHLFSDLDFRVHSYCYSYLYLYLPFTLPSFTKLQFFQRDAVRYPLLFMLAASHCGKTEWAESLFIQYGSGTLCRVGWKIHKLIL